MSLVEPLPYLKRPDGGVERDPSEDALVRMVAIASGLGSSSARTWLKIPATADPARVAAATTCPVLLLGGDAGRGWRQVFDRVAQRPWTSTTSADWSPAASCSTRRSSASPTRWAAPGPWSTPSPPHPARRSSREQPPPRHGAVHRRQPRDRHARAGRLGVQRARGLRPRGGPGHPRPRGRRGRPRAAVRDRRERHGGRRRTHPAGTRRVSSPRSPTGCTCRSGPRCVLSGDVGGGRPVHGAGPSGPSRSRHARPRRSRWRCAAVAAATRQVTNIATPGSFDGADRINVCEVLTPGGNVSSWPPHRHDGIGDCAPTNEEIYYFRMGRLDSPHGHPHGQGLFRVYTVDGIVRRDRHGARRGRVPRARGLPRSLDRAAGVPDVLPQRAGRSRGGAHDGVLRRPGPPLDQGHRGPTPARTRGCR